MFGIKEQWSRFTVIIVDCYILKLFCYYFSQPNSTFKLLYHYISKDNNFLSTDIFIAINSKRTKFWKLITMHVLIISKIGCD